MNLNSADLKDNFRLFSNSKIDGQVLWIQKEVCVIKVEIKLNKLKS